MKRENDILFLLIKSLTKSEKRQFKLHVGRIASNSDAKFVALFDSIDKLTYYEEEKIIEKTSISKKQLANAKQNLYHQVLTALRSSPKHQTLKIQLREQIDFATILYNKGLYEQSLKILGRSKVKAIENFENTIAFELVEFEKLIETQYISRTLISRADDLAITAKEMSVSNVMMSKLSNLSLQLYSFLLKNGYAKSEEDLQLTSAYFNYHLPKYTTEELGFREKLYLYMAQLWHSLIIQDFTGSYKNASNWVALFDSHPKMIEANPVFYLKGGNYLLEALYFLRYKSKFNSVLDEFKRHLNESNFPQNANTKTLKFLYVTYHEINQHFLSGSFELGVDMIDDIELEIKQLDTQIDDHHVLVFYYKFACLHFGLDRHNKCIYYLDKIVENKNLGLREDLLCFTRILRLISHYESGKDEQIEHLIKDTFKFLLKMNDFNQVQTEIILFLRSLNKIFPHELKTAFKELYGRLKKLENHRFEKRSFLYLDILSWLEGKIQGKNIQSIVIEKAKNMK